MGTNAFLIIFCQHLAPAMPKARVDTTVSELTHYVQLLKLLTTQVSHLFIWLKLIFTGL